MDDIAEAYVKLVLAVGRHDADYVDAYYGPPEWKAEAEATKVPLPEIRPRRGAASPRPRRSAAPGAAIETAIRRATYLPRQLQALGARLDMLAGKRFTFDEESQALYDAVAPALADEHFAGRPRRAGAAAPRRRPAPARYEAFRQGFVIPRDGSTRSSAPPSTSAARRTRPHRAAGRRELRRRVRHGQAVERLQLVQGRLPQPDPGQHRPADLHRPRDRPRLPRGLSRPPRLQRAAREAPACASAAGWSSRSTAVHAAVADRRGHRQLRHRGGVPRRGARRVRARACSSRWPGSTRRGRRVLPGAGARRAARLRRQRGGAPLPRRRDRRPRRRPTGWALRPHVAGARRAARPLLRPYRSYVINYNLGQDLVRAYVEARGGTADQPERRWQEFKELLSSPRLPSALER